MKPEGPDGKVRFARIALKQTKLSVNYSIDCALQRLILKNDLPQYCRASSISVEVSAGLKSNPELMKLSVSWGKAIMKEDAFRICYQGLLRRIYNCEEDELRSVVPNEIKFNFTETTDDLVLRVSVKRGLQDPGMYFDYSLSQNQFA